MIGAPRLFGKRLFPARLWAKRRVAIKPPAPAPPPAKKKKKTKKLVLE